MKKRISFIFMALLIFAFSMNAYAKNKTVNPDFSVSLTTTTCTVSGTTGTPGDTDSYALAVAIQIREAGTNNVVAMNTAGTSAGAFNTTLTGLSLTAGASYDIYVADYEGGAWEKVTATAIDNGGSAQPGGSGDGSAQITGLVVPVNVTFEGATAAELSSLAASTVVSLYDSNVAEINCAFPTYDAATGKTSLSFQLPIPATGEIATYYLRESVQPTSLGYGLASDKVYIVYTAAYANGKVAMIFVDASTGLEVPNIVFENQRVENLDIIDDVPTTGDTFWPIIGFSIGGIILLAAGTIFIKRRSR